jgi:hypothetical protein
VQLRATAGSPVAGKCFAIVELVRGRAGAVQPLGTLLEGYVSDVQRLAWPGSPLRSSVDTPGVSSIITGTDPAAGSECLDTVPAGARWEVLAWFATLVASAAVANRVVTLIIDDGASTLWTCDASVAQTASQTRNYNAYATGVAPDLTGTTFRLPGPFPLDLPAGARIRTSTALLDAGRQLGRAEDSCSRAYRRLTTRQEKRMHIDWRSVSHVAAAVIGAMVPGVAQAEELAWKLGSHDNKQKADDVVALGKSTLTALESVVGKDLANDADVDHAHAVRCDSVVDLHKVVAKKTVAAVL